ncbi:NAD(P)/FAD-dependent oxidoreductase [Catenulispora subtropica]|uniref:Pyridine nucleotide-disulfide oxidoreductase domain-containing protein 2 n=1 Tax=Catenulispora subtropica TaxID=450798 RepID=A0ABP5DFZ6_9ACTN
MTVALPERAERTPRPGASRHDVVVVGGGHNALVAAAYLARAGLHVTVLERRDEVGGAAVSATPFAGLDARLSRYSYLVSLLPYTIVRNLELVVELRSRPVSSYTPLRRGGRDTGLLVERKLGAATEESFRRITGGDADFQAWRRFYEQLGRLARALAPTLLNPLLGRGQLEALAREEGAGQAWEWVFEQPIGVAVEQHFGDDAVRGVVLTDALIGTDSWAGDASLKQNRCFLYHVMGNGNGEWRVPVGGMGSVAEALHRSAENAGARILTGAEVLHIDPDAGGGRAEVTYRDAAGTEQTVQAGYVLAGVAPAVLTRLLGRGGGAQGPHPQGTQLKINMLLDRLPRLKSGADPHVAFAGTFHIDEGAGQLRDAYQRSHDGALPDPLPSEVYCHTLTDRSILGKDLLKRPDVQTLTLFSLHTPPGAASKDEMVRRALAGLDAYLAEPLADCLAVDADGAPCLEAKTTEDLQAELAMPGGHIFHRDLSWPYAERADQVGKWGVETGIDNVLICGAGARRGGGVSGIPGHNAARAVLDRVADAGRRRSSGI